PRFLAFLTSALHAHQRPAAAKLFPRQRELEMALAVTPPRIAVRAPRSPVPQRDRSRAVLFFWNHTLEAAVIERVVLDVHGKPFFRRIEARALRHRPALERSVELETEVVMQAAGCVLLHDEAQPRAPPRGHAALRLRSLAEIAFAMVALETHDRAHSAADSVPAWRGRVLPCAARSCPPASGKS